MVVLVYKHIFIGILTVTPFPVSTDTQEWIPWLKTNLTTSFFSRPQLFSIFYYLVYRATITDTIIGSIFP